MSRRDRRRFDEIVDFAGFGEFLDAPEALLVRACGFALLSLSRPRSAPDPRRRRGARSRGRHIRHRLPQPMLSSASGAHGRLCQPRSGCRQTALHSDCLAGERSRGTGWCDERGRQRLRRARSPSTPEVAIESGARGSVSPARCRSARAGWTGAGDRAADRPFTIRVRYRARRSHFLNSTSPSFSSIRAASWRSTRCSRTPARLAHNGARVVPGDADRPARACKQRIPAEDMGGRRRRYVPLPGSVLVSPLAGPRRSRRLERNGRVSPNQASTGMSSPTTRSG